MHSDPSERCCSREHTNASNDLLFKFSLLNGSLIILRLNRTTFIISVGCTKTRIICWPNGYKEHMGRDGNLVHQIPVLGKLSHIWPPRHKKTHLFTDDFFGFHIPHFDSIFHRLWNYMDRIWYYSAIQRDSSHVVETF